MEKGNQKGTSLKLSDAKPTKVPIEALYQWVIWQFPKFSSKGAFAAVHPPIDDNGWYPAIIKFKKKQVFIYGHLNLLFPTPEEAMIFIAKSHKA